MYRFHASLLMWLWSIMPENELPASRPNRLSATTMPPNTIDSVPSVRGVFDFIGACG